MKRFPDSFQIPPPRLKPGPLILLAVVLLIRCPVASAALEKSSKKACAICHVMWLDEFRTSRETLIKWQPGNVLMKDTQGVVSSEDMCYSCHDGYVADARFTVWKYNSHPVFKKLSKKVNISAPFTLSNKGEIYCGTCHSPHSGEKAVPETSAKFVMPGPLFFLRMANVDSSMCEKCHVKEADYHRTHGHPLHTDKLRIPDSLFRAGAVKAEKKNTVICQSCHRVHGARGTHLLLMDNSGSALCAACHKERTLLGTPHDPRLTLPHEKNRKGETLAESGPCGACHLPHDSAGYKLWARIQEPGNPASQLCLSCHTGKPGDKIKGIGRFSHSLDVDALKEPGGKRRCLSSLTKALPLFAKDGQATPTGTLQCFTCHNVHQWNPADAAKRGGKEAKADASNSFLRIGASGNSALCLECHRDKRQLLAYGHNLVRSAPEAKNSKGETARSSGPCGACHLPHNAADKRLWARALPKASASAPRYCRECHSEKGVARKKTVGKNDHPVDVASKGPGIAPASRVAAVLPLFDKKGREGDIIRCLTCHEPHIWSKRDGENVAATPAAPLPEGDARNSFLRRPASPTPDLCAVCHKDAPLIVGTDHDLFVTAPKAKNELGQTVSESGQCGVCHAVHNSPEKRLLWDRALGPVGKDMHPMDALCTGCHSKGGVAKDKIPAVASHPAGKLIDNIFSNRHEPTGYTKIFDQNWKETRVGDLSCSSCHSFGWWDHRVRKPGPGRKIEGTAETSFLRTSSDRTVCIDCHGKSAIWRYLYFHSLEKRKMLKGVWP